MQIYHARSSVFIKQERHADNKQMKIHNNYYFKTKKLRMEFDLEGQPDTKTICMTNIY